MTWKHTKIWLSIVKSRICSGLDEASVSTTSRRDLMTPKLSCWVMSFGLALVCPYTHRICGYPYPINYWVDIAFTLDFSSWDWNRTKELAFWDLTVRNGSYLTWELYLQGKYWWIITNIALNSKHVIADWRELKWNSAITNPTSLILLLECMWGFRTNDISISWVSLFQ